MNLLFWKKNKYDIKPEDNVPQKAYGIPDYMRKEKYDINVEDNYPQDVYGIPHFIKEDRKTVFSAFEGGFFGPSYYFYVDKCNDDNYEFKYGYSKDGRIILNDNNASLRIVRQNKAYYKKFIDELIEEVKDWEERYVNPDVMDGTQWNIDLIELNRKYSGSNSFPKNYRFVLRLLEKYFNSEECLKKCDENEKYDIKPEDNQPQRVYGVPDFLRDKKNEQNDNNQEDNLLKRSVVADKYYGYHSKNNITGNDGTVTYLTDLMIYFDGFDYKNDDDFVLCGRKKFVYDEIIDILNGNGTESVKNPVYFALGSLEEFICNPNSLAASEVGNKELMDKNDRYNSRDIISFEEKEYIIDIIKRLLTYIAENPNQNEKYDVKPEDNQPQRVYGVPNSMFKIAKCPNCNSTNLKKYLYGMPSKDYDTSKYILGGCIIDGKQPSYKCMDCGKDF